MHPLSGFSSGSERLKQQFGCHPEETKKATILGYRDAFSTGAGAMIGLSVFATNQIDFIVGISVFVLVLLALTQPEVLDMETQYSIYKSRHAQPLTHLIHVLFIWPQLFTFMMCVACLSRWAFLLALYYAVYYVVAERSVPGFTAALIVVACHKLAVNCVTWYDDAFSKALIVHAVCWSFQLVGIFLTRRWRMDGVVPWIRENFLQVVVMSPLLVIIELFVTLGFHKDFARRTRSNVSNLLKERKLRSESEGSSCG